MGQLDGHEGQIRLREMAKVCRPITTEPCNAKLCSAPIRAAGTKGGHTIGLVLTIVNTNSYTL